MSVINITQYSGIPLVGSIAFGIIDRGTDLIQVRPTTICNQKCIYCSTNANNPKVHPVNYIVEVNYLLAYIKEVADFKEVPIECNIDSVGEVMSYSEIITLVKGIKKLKNVKKISMQTNGSLLTEEKIKTLEKAGMDQINLSINTFDTNLAKKLAGMEQYEVSKIKTIAKRIAESKINLLIAPVWMLNINEMEPLIKFAKELNAQIGIQKYEVYKNSRKVKTKLITYWKFYDQMRKWEKEYDLKLIIKKSDMNISKAKRFPTKFIKGEKINVKIKCPGWWKGQMLAVAKNRTITISDCKANPNDNINVKIVENKNNIYVAIPA